jgi:hypothetical protein
VDDCSGGGALDGPVQDGLNTQLELPTSDTFTLLGFETGEIQEADPLPDIVEPVAPAAPVAPAPAPVEAAPTFTG